MNDWVEIYSDAAEQWRWRRKAGNNRIVGESGEGYQDFNYAREVAIKKNKGCEVKVRRDNGELEKVAKGKKAKTK